MVPVTAVVFGLMSAAIWGAGDFCGGLAARRATANSVVIASQLVGVLLLTALAGLFREPWPAASDLAWGALAGVAGNVGLLALDRGLASGRMGVVAPLSAVLSAALPVLVSALFDGLPGWVTLVGFALALAGVWLLAQPAGGAVFRLNELGLPLLAGLGFGLFFVFVDQVSAAAVFWPLVMARLASLAFLTSVTVAGRQKLWPPAGVLPLTALSGVLDAAGNAFFALATQTGRLDVAAVLSALYPGSTVLLAWAVLRERLTRAQLAGVAAALVAIILIAW